VFHTKLSDSFMTYLHPKFHVPSCSYSLGIIETPKVKYRFRHIVSFRSTREFTSTKVAFVSEVRMAAMMAK